jgi:hypothetical protein
MPQLRGNEPILGLNRDQLRYHILVALVIMLLLLMMQLEKLGFIAFNKNLMFFILLRNGKLWLKMI